MKSLALLLILASVGWAQPKCTPEPKDWKQLKFGTVYCSSISKFYDARIAELSERIKKLEDAALLSDSWLHQNFGGGDAALKQAIEQSSTYSSSDNSLIVASFIDPITVTEPAFDKAVIWTFLIAGKKYVFDGAQLAEALKKTADKREWCAGGNPPPDQSNCRPVSTMTSDVHPATAPATPKNDGKNEAKTVK